MHLQRPGALLTCGECQLAQIVYYGEAPGKRRSVEKQGWDTGPRCAACVHFYYRAMRGWAAGWTLRLASNQNEGLRRKAGAFKAKEPTRREEADTKRGSRYGARGRRAGCVAGGSRRGRQRGRSCVATEGPTFLQPSEVRRPRGRRFILGAAVPSCYTSDVSGELAGPTQTGRGTTIGAWLVGRVMTYRPICWPGWNLF